MANTPLPPLMCPGWKGLGPGKGCTSGNAREVLGCGLEHFSAPCLGECGWLQCRVGAEQGKVRILRLSCEAMEDSLVWGGRILIFLLNFNAVRSSSSLLSILVSLLRRKESKARSHLNPKVMGECWMESRMQVST